MTSLFILGPSAWEGRPHSEVPPSFLTRAADGTAPRPAGEPSPLDVRRALVLIAARPDVVATVMEDWTRQGKELHSDLFRRIESEARITHYVIFWPKGGRLQGLGWELSDLVHRIMDRRLDRRAVRIFAERGIVDWDHGTEEYVFLEPENRTRYYNDLLQLECPVRVWDDYSELAFALEHQDWR